MGKIGCTWSKDVVRIHVPFPVDFFHTDGSLFLPALDELHYFCVADGGLSIVNNDRDMARLGWRVLSLAARHHRQADDFHQCTDGMADT